METIKKLFTKRLLFILLFINILLNAFFVARYNPLNSDSVYGEVLYGDLFKSRIYLPSDPFLLYHSLSYILIRLFGYTLSAKFIGAFILIVSTLGLFCLFYHYFVRKYLSNQRPTYYLPLFLFLNISWPFYNFINWPRNIEFGLVLLSTVYFDNLRSLSRNKLLELGTYFLLLLVIFSDPYFLYLFIIPLITVLALKIKEGRESRKAVSFLSITVIVNAILHTLLNISPYFFYYEVNAHLASGLRLISNINLTLEGIFHILNFSYLPPLIFPLELGFFLAGIYGLFILLKERTGKGIIPSLLALIFLATIGAYLFSAHPADLDSSRYLFFTLFIMPVGIASLISKITSNLFKTVFIGILLTLSAINFISINNTAYANGNSEPYKSNKLVIETVQRNNLYYGYTSYWNAAINTYLSGNTTSFRQVICFQHQIAPYYWLSSDSWYQKSSQISKSFLLIDFTDKLTPELKGCSNTDMVKQFGQPNKILPIKTNLGTFSLLIFHYNIAEKFRLK